MPLHYLDNAATTQVAPEVIELICETMQQFWGNPSALYRHGQAAKKLLDNARDEIAKPFGISGTVKPGRHSVFFTASGTEADNIAVLGAARARKTWGKKLVATGYEHSAVSQALERLAKHEGFTLVKTMPDENCCVDIQALTEAVDKETALVCAMHVNNETGAILDVESIARAAKEKNPRCFVHVDGVQAYGKLPLTLMDSCIDSYAVSGHKLHAPKGIGALIMPKGRPANFEAPLFGGGQEESLRPGTENIAFAAGFAKAVQLEHQNYAKTAGIVRRLRKKLLAGLPKLGDIHLHIPKAGLDNLVMFSMPRGLRSQMVLNALDEMGVCVSSGSACKGGAASATLTAMGIPPHLVDTAIRVSFSCYNAEDDVDALLFGLKDVIAKRARDVW